jgi:hypothetical protein
MYSNECISYKCVYLFVYIDIYVHMCIHIYTYVHMIKNICVYSKINFFHIHMHIQQNLNRCIIMQSNNHLIGCSLQTVVLFVTGRIH